MIVAGAGGAAHLPGMLAAKTLLPVIGVPIPTQHLGGLDSLLSIVQMPRGIPVATVAIGNAPNAGLLAAADPRPVRSDPRRAPRRVAGGADPGACWTIPRTPALSPAQASRSCPAAGALAVLGQVEPEVHDDLERDEDRHGRGRRPGRGDRPCAPKMIVMWRTTSRAVRREHLRPRPLTPPVLAATEEVEPVRDPWLIARATTANSIGPMSNPIMSVRTDDGPTSRHRRTGVVGTARSIGSADPMPANNGSVSTNTPWTNQKIP